MFGKNKDKEKPKGKHYRLKKLGKRLLIAFIIFWIVFLVVAFWPIPKEPLITPDKINSEVFKALSKFGITSSNTKLDGSVVSVSYKLPEKATRESADLYILGVLSSLVSNQKTAVITAYSGQNKIGSIEVLIQDILKRDRGEITTDELKKRIKQV